MEPHGARLRRHRLRSISCRILLVICAVLWGSSAIEPVPQASDIVTMVNKNSQKDIRLDANIYIPDGGELLLTIDVPREKIIVDSQAPAKVTRVYSTHANGVFGVGEAVDVFVEFTSAVDVIGSPSLTLATGCHNSQCHVREIQRLRCQGTVGKFAVGFDGQRAVNIPWDASEKMFAGYLQRMTKLDRVIVQYLQAEGSACTFFGNNITVTFESVNIIGEDGNLPEMTADGANLHGDGTSLGHVRLDALVSANAWEIQRGRRVQDRQAAYVGKANARTLQFAYVVQVGDSTAALEYASSDSLTQSIIASGSTIQILNTGTTVAADTTLPPPASKGDWERGLGSSLATSSSIQIDGSQPTVVSITSTHEDGTFGIGEVLLIHVHFSLPVVATGLPTLVLETGQVDRIIPFTKVTGAQENVVEFQYTVQSRDTSPDLTYTGTNALQLNGGSIKRKSTTPTTDAILTLPVNGERGSLSFTKNIVIDTSNPKVTGVTTLTPDGTYTGGDTIQIQVAFDAPVVVTGTPQLLLSTGSVDIYPGSFVEIAPTLASGKEIEFPAVDHGLSTAKSLGLQFLIDGQLYTLASVAGDTVTMVETYTGTVVDPTVINRPLIPIMSPGYRPAVYSSGSGTRNLVFTYEVQVGDSSLDLAYVSTSALQLNSGSIKRLSTTPFSDADLTLATPGTRGSLSFSAALVVNTDRPRVLQVNAVTRDGVYRARDELFLAVVFDMPVVVDPTASLRTTASAVEDRFAVYAQGSGTTTVVFRFECKDTDQVAVFDVFDSAALRPGYGATRGTIHRRSSSPLINADLTLPIAGLSTKLVKIDQSSAYVKDVATSHETATVGAGEIVDLIVTYSAAVDIDVAGGTPTMLLSTMKSAAYTSGSGTASLTFRYTVQPDDATVRLNYVDIYALHLNGATIKDTTTATLAATLLPAPAASTLGTTQRISVDTNAPFVVSVSTRLLDGAYTVGDRVPIAVEMNQAVVVAPASSNAGVPTLYLHVGGATSVSDPAAIVSVSDERLYFSMTVVAGQSTASLAYPSRISLRCVGNYGLNKDGAQSNAVAPHGVEFRDRLHVVWSEKSTVTGSAQIRAKSLDTTRPFGAAWTHEDGDGTTGRVQFASAMDATNPMLAMLTADRLYACWQEQSATLAGNPTQIRVASYLGGDVSVLQRWRFVDRSPAVTSGINRDPLQSAASPHMVVHSSKLYVAWHESVASSTATQIRVAVFNGQDLAPTWTFVDGNSATRGINYAFARVARNVRLASCRSTLYAVWEELISDGTSQVRVASLTGTDIAPKWVFVDGAVATAGLNYNSAMHARAPSMTCVGDTTLVVAWHEVASIGNGATRTRIRAKQLLLTSPTLVWRPADGGSAINFDSMQNAVNVRLRTHTLTAAALFSTWEEIDVGTGKSQIRAAMYTGGDTGSWSLVDGASKLSTINYVATQHATAPILVSSRTLPGTWYATWQEVHGTTQMTHVRTSIFRPGADAWQSLHDRCVLRKSTASTTPSNLLLPEVSTAGALDFNRQIRIDTARPTVKKVSFTSASRAMASTSVIQTVDIFNAASLTQGQYQLSYDGEATVCIDWNAAATAIESALEGISTLSLGVQVAKDTTSFQDATRYTITFTFPTTGIKPLKLRDDTATCAAWTCTASTPLLPCNAKSLIQLNANRNVPMHSGVVDTQVQFSSPVVVTTTPPVLVLETGAVDTAATYTTRGIVRQFDVGTESPSAVLAGAFRLAYGDSATPNAMEITECIDTAFSSHADAEQELWSKLRAIKALRTIGIRSVARTQRRNGYRYIVQFASSSTGSLLDLIPADATGCEAFAGRTQTIDIQADTAIVQGEFQITYEYETSACIPASIRAAGRSSSLEAVVSSIVPDRVIPLQVVQDTSIFGAKGHRYYISYMMLSDAVHPLGVVASGACAAFRCDDGNGGNVACTGLKLTANAGFEASSAATDTLAFQYTVQATDSTSDLAVRDINALTGDIFRQSLNPTLAATLSLPASTPSKIRVVGHSEIPRVTRVYSSTLDDTYSAGDVIVIYVVFSQAVNVVGTPMLELNSKGTALFLSGSGTTTLEFRYRVQAGDASTDLDYLSTLSLRTPGLFTTIIVAGSGGGTGEQRIEADLTLPIQSGGFNLAAQHQLVIQTAAPTVISVSSTRTDTAAGGQGYGVGDIVDIVVTFSSEVAVIGMPRIALNSGGTAIFTYAGYRQLLDIGVHAMYPVTSGQFAVSYRGEVSGCIDYTDPSSAAVTSLKSRLLEFPELASIGIVSVTRSAKKNGYRFEIVFDSTRVLEVPESVVPVVSDVCAPLLPSSPSSPPDSLLERATETQVVFHYHVKENDGTADLDCVAAAIDLATIAGSAVLRRSRSPIVNAVATLPAAGDANRLSALKTIAIDGSPVVIVDTIADSAAGTYGVAYPPIASPATVYPGEILFRVIFSRPVKVVGSPTIELATGSLQANGVFLPNRVATFVNQPQPNEAAFLYRIQEGDTSANLAFANLNVLATATVFCVSTSSLTMARTSPLPRLTVSATKVLEIDATSVPTTVELSSSHPDGVYGAGEAIEIQLKFSKPVTLQTGLNRNHDFYARHPIAVEHQGLLYVLWTEWSTFERKPSTTSYLYLRVFDASTLTQQVLAPSRASAINQLADTFIEKASLAVWQNSVYAAWDENAQIYCARFNGLAVGVPTEAWTLIPHMIANKDPLMKASGVQLIVHNLELVMVWREEAMVGGALVGQIRAAQRNDDVDAPLWIFHDGKQATGLNRNTARDAKDPHAVVYRGAMYLTWTEFSDAVDAYVVVMARRYVQNRDQSVWKYMEFVTSSTWPSEFYLSSYQPRLAVRRRGFEDAALLVTWHRDITSGGGSQVVYGEVQETYWTELTPSIPTQVRPQSLTSHVIRNTKSLVTQACGDDFFAAWIEETSLRSVGLQTLRVGTLTIEKELNDGWKAAFTGVNSVGNHNASYDVNDVGLICSHTSVTDGAMGIFWTEFDGITTKLRLRHANIPQRLASEKEIAWGETSEGTPLLLLDTGTIPPGSAFAIDRSGLTSRVLTFLYVVRPGDVSLDLDAVSQQALEVNGAQVRDFYGQIPDFTLFPRSQDPRSLSFNSDLVIDTTPPVVVNVTSSTPSGEYGVGEVISIQVKFSLAVAVEGTTPPVLYIRSDELHLTEYTANAATYVSGSGTTTLVFVFTTSEKDYCERLDYFRVDSLALLSADTKIRRLATFPVTDATLTLPAPKSAHSLSGNRHISIKPTQPTITSVSTVRADGTYYPGDTIPIRVTFSLPVVVYGTPVLLLDTGRPGDPTTAPYVSGNESTVLVFDYVVAAGDVATDLDVVDDRETSLINYVQSLVLAGQSSIKRKSTSPVTNAVLAMPAPGLPGSLSAAKTIVIDTVSPKIIDVKAVTPDGTYDVGQEIDILVTFSKQVVVSQGTPFLKLNVPQLSEWEPRLAVYQSGSETNVLHFKYKVQEGDNTGTTPLDNENEKSFLLAAPRVGPVQALTSARVLCRSASPVQAANLTMPRPGPILRVDAVRSLVGNNQKIFLRTDGLRVKSIVADVASGEVCAPGQRIVLSVGFTGVVVVQGVPRLKLNANALLPTYARYISGSGTRTLAFEFIAAMGDEVSVLEAPSRLALELPPGSIVTDPSGLYVPLRLGAPRLPGSLSFQYQLAISSTPPVVMRVFVANVEVSQNGAFGVGDTVKIGVQFSRKVAMAVGATVMPSLLLQLANGARGATYSAGDRSDTLVFSLLVGIGDTASPLDYASVNSLVVPPTGLFAAATTLLLPVDSILPVPGGAGSLAATSGIRITSTPPTVVAVDAVDRNGVYALGDRLRLRVRFSYRVLVVSTQPCGLGLMVGGNKAAIANFIGGSTTDALMFEYRIIAGDRTSRLDYRSTTSLSCSILQLSAVPSLAADTTLPLPGADGSLGSLMRIQVDATAPRITSVSSLLPNGVYGAGQTIDIQVTFSEAVLVLDPVACSPRLRLAIANAAAMTGRASRDATFTGGSGSPTLVFQYVTQVGDAAYPVAYDGVNALFLDTSATCGIVAATPDRRGVSLRLPVPGTSGSLSNNRHILVDAVEPPRVLAVGSAMADGIYTAGDTVTVSITFTTPVVVTGTPYLLLDVGQSTPAMATYTSGSQSATLVFSYTIQQGDHSDRLEYVRCPIASRRRPQRREYDKLVMCLSADNALQLGVGGSIKRVATTPSVDAILDLPEVNRWPKLRIATSRQDYVYVDQLDDRSDLPVDERQAATALDHTLSLKNEVSISHTKGAVHIYSNGIPSHAVSMKPTEQTYFIELVRFPTQQPNPLSLADVDGFIGVMINGIPFKRLAPSSPPADECGGTVDDKNRYYYASVPTCLIADLVESAQPSESPFVSIGIAFDGYPVYHRFNETGQVPERLDECHGMRGTNGAYRYHLVTPPSTTAGPFMPCLKGINNPPDAAAGEAAKLITVFKSPVNIRQVDGLTLASLSKFDGLVVDENAATVAGTSTWLNPRGVSVVYSATTIIVRSTGVPDGEYGPFPNAYNSFPVRAQDYVFQLPRQPVIAATLTPAPLDTPLGVMLNGIPFFATQSAVYGGSMMNTSRPTYWMMDKCHGFVDSGGNYRYYASPDCLIRELGEQLTPGKASPLIGYALDGFPVYGPFNEAGVAPTDLDQCNGRIGDDGGYRYHVTLAKAPYIIGCFRGTPSFASSDRVHRSLSFANAIRIDTQVPRVTQIFTNKYPGRYTLGETLDIVTQWSSPVTVDTTNGLPYVSIPGTNPPQRAVYDSAKSTASQSVFVFTVSALDPSVIEYEYDFRATIQLNGGRIKRSAAVPTIDADVNLVSAERTSRFASKHQLVRDIRVVLRGLYHPHASDLRVQLYHEDRSAVIFDRCCGAMAFGVPDETLRINEQQIHIYPDNPTSGVGHDYGFQDFTTVKTKNLARDGGATAIQSATSGQCFASNAIDGRTSGMVTTQDVARASPPANATGVAWWELRLIKPVEIGTIRVWLPTRPDLRRAAVQILEVDSADGVAQVYGSFTLQLTTWTGEIVTTAAINWNAVAMVRDEDEKIENLGIGKGESIEAKILAALPKSNTPKQSLFVTRSPAVASTSANGAFTWSITFEQDTHLYAENAVPLTVGVNDVCDGTGVVKLSVPLRGDDHDDWKYLSRDDDGRPPNLRVGHVSMFPFWIMLFEDTAIMDFETFREAHNASSWSYRVEESQNLTQLVSVNPPVGLTHTQFIRIVAEKPKAYLTIAEVEVYTERNHVLSQYPSGTPVSTEFYPGGETWSPEESFQQCFGQMTSEGTWRLAIRDIVKQRQLRPERKQTNGAGAISDWVLQVTNVAGKTRSYYMDIRAHIKSMPRFGKLYVSIAQTDTEHLDRDQNGVLDLVEADQYLSSYFLSYNVLPSPTRQRVLWNFLDGYTAHGGIEILTDPSERQKIYPNPVCDRQCLEDLGLDPYYAGGMTGDRALKPMQISRDRVVRFIPNADYTGEDAFTFTIAIGSQESAVQETVKLYVRQCQDVNCVMDAAFLHRRRINPIFGRG